MAERDARVLILATSLNPHSKSRTLADYAHARLIERGIDTELLDLRDFGELPLTGSPSAGHHPGIVRVKEAMRAATHLVMAVPVYNFNLNAAAKNIVELMGVAELEGKTVGFLCMAAGPRAYMSVLGLANTLMLDFRCWIVPRFVYAVRGEVEDGQVVSETIQQRIEQLTTELFERIPPDRSAGK
jgi:NAD(P)H-dependent FMN reductase